MGKKIKQKHNRQLLFVVALLIGVCYYSFIETHPQKGWDYKPQYKAIAANSAYSDIKDGELPEIKDSTYFVRNTKGRYAFHYEPKHAISQWVAYKLTRNDLKGEKVKRSNKFRPDSVVVARGWHTATDADYYRSSYNRGHLVPSSDRNRTKIENVATFNYANVAPQHGRLNSGVWLMVESKVKEWAYAYNEVYVVAGSIVAEDTKYIGENKVAIPTHFYKCVALCYEGKWYGIGFVIPNEKDVSDDYTRYETTINKVEKLIGKDLFPNIEKIAGGKFERKKWLLN